MFSFDVGGSECEKLRGPYARLPKRLDDEVVALAARARGVEHGVHLLGFEVVREMFQGTLLRQILAASIRFCTMG